MVQNALADSGLCCKAKVEAFIPAEIGYSLDKMFRMIPGFQMEWLYPWGRGTLQEMEDALKA